MTLDQSALNPRGVRRLRSVRMETEGTPEEVGRGFWDCRSGRWLRVASACDPLGSRSGKCSARHS